MGVLPDSEEPSVGGRVGNCERDQEGKQPQCTGPLMGPGGSESSGLVVCMVGPHR